MCIDKIDSGEQVNKCLPNLRSPPLSVLEYAVALLGSDREDLNGGGLRMQVAA